MLSLPFQPLARDVPQTVIPEPTTAGAVTIGWLLDAARAHRLPGSAYHATASAHVVASDAFRLSFDRPHRAAPETGCHTSRDTVVMRLRAGDTLGVYSNAVYLEPVSSTLVGIDPIFTPAPDAPIVVLRDVGAVRVIPLPGNGPVRVCTG